MLITIDHEDGHVLFDSLHPDVQKKWQTIYKKFGTKWGNISEIAGARNASGEAFAESFALVANGNDRLLLQYVVQYIREVMK